MKDDDSRYRSHSIHKFDGALGVNYTIELAGDTWILFDSTNERMEIAKSKARV